MTAPLHLHSASAATDGAWLAASDVATVAGDLGARYRLVGGVAVTLLTHAHDIADKVPQRETADADLAVPTDVCADPRLVVRLAEYPDRP